MVCDSRLHSWRDAQRFVNPAEIVMQEVKSNRMLVILDFLREAIRERESAQAHSHR